MRTRRNLSFLDTPQVDRSAMFFSSFFVCSFSLSLCVSLVFSPFLFPFFCECVWWSSILLCFFFYIAKHPLYRCVVVWLLVEVKTKKHKKKMIRIK